MELPQTFQDWEEFFDRFEQEMKDSNTYDKDKMELLQFAADELLKSNDYQGAKNFLQRSLTLAKKTENLLAQGRILNMLAQIFYAQQQFDDALGTIEQALDIFKSQKGDSSPEVIDMYNNLAIILEAAGRYDEAVSMMMENIKRVKESKDFDELYLATSYNNLAGIFWSRQQPKSALEYLSKAKQIKEEHLPADDPQLIEIYNNLALVNLSLGNISQAEHFQKRALDSIEKNNPESHEKVTALRNMALIYQEQGMTIEALDLLNQAITLLKRIFPYGHPEIDEAEKIKQEWEKQL